MSQYQQKYWSLLRELRTHVIYLHKYATHSENWDKGVNIFLAISSSTSIAAWAIWKEHQFIWATIIAISQVITSVKPFLPYKQRLKPITDLNDSIQEISLECEKCWYEVAEGELNEREIHERYISIKEKVLKAEKRTLKGIVLPTNNGILKRAEIEADVYLRSNYH